MSDRPLPFGVAVVAVVLGLVSLVFGEATGGSDLFLLVGGVVALGGVGLLTALVARTPRPEGAEHG
jgi:hypothetical protein